MKLEINGMPVHYIEHGQGRPLLCIHGFPEDHGVMVGCVEPLMTEADAYRRIYIDLPGMGLSPANFSIRCGDDMLDTLQGFIREVIEEEQFLLAGQSYGGYLALGLTYKMAAQIAGLYLLCPCTIADRTRRILPKRKLVRREEIVRGSGATEAEFEEFLEYAAVATQYTWDRYAKEILPAFGRADEAFITAYQSGAGYGFSFESAMREGIHFEGPACFLTGALDDCTGYADAWALLPGFQDASFTALAGAGHNAQIEYPEYFGFTFRDWLGRCALEKKANKTAENRC